MTEQNQEIRIQQLESKVEKMREMIIELHDILKSQEELFGIHTENFNVIKVALEDNLGIFESQRKMIEELSTRFKNHINSESHNI